MQISNDIKLLLYENSNSPRMTRSQFMKVNKFQKGSLVDHGFIIGDVLEKDNIKHNGFTIDHHNINFIHVKINSKHPLSMSIDRKNQKYIYHNGDHIINGGEYPKTFIDK